MPETAKAGVGDIPPRRCIMDMIRSSGPKGDNESPLQKKIHPMFPTTRLFKVVIQTRNYCLGALDT